MRTIVIVLFFAFINSTSSSSSLNPLSAFRLLQKRIFAAQRQSLSPQSSIETKFDAEHVYRSISNAVNQSSLSGECLEDILILVDALEKRNGTIFTNVVMPMVDASGKLPPGILKGRFTFSGHYSECVAINEPVEGRGRKIQGEYFRFFMALGLQSNTATGACDGSQSVSLSLDFCLPSACSSSELQSVFRPKSSQSSNGTVMSVCHVVAVNDNLDEGGWGYYLVVAIMVCIVIVCTFAGLMDFYFTRIVKDTPVEYSLAWRSLMCFSLYTNVGSIFDVSNANKEGQIGSIHCIRSISMMWVVLCHIFLFTFVSADNPLDILELLNDVPTELIVNGFFSVDSFFFLSGLLLSFLWFKIYDKNPRQTTSPMAWTMFYIHRILRLIPPFYFAILFRMFIQNALSTNSPASITETPIPPPCRGSWWAEMLFLNNYLGSEMCLAVTWYIDADMQMFLFTPLILIPLARKPVAGIIVAIAALVASTAANIVTVYVHNYGPMAINAPGDVNLDDRFKLMYSAPYIRCQVYIMGMLTGWALQKWKKVRIHPLINLILWGVSFALMLTVILGLYDYNKGGEMSIFWRAMYTALSRIAWGIGLAYIIAACYYGMGGPINSFMSWYIWIPMSRLTYCAYLTHFMLVQILLSRSTDGFVFTGFFDLFCTRIVSYIFLALVLALLWSSCFELPFGKLEMMAFGFGGRKGIQRGKTEDGGNRNGKLNGGFAGEVDKTEEGLNSVVLSIGKAELGQMPIDQHQIVVDAHF